MASVTSQPPSRAAEVQPMMATAVAESVEDIETPSRVTVEPYEYKTCCAMCKCATLGKMIVLCECSVEEEDKHLMPEGYANTRKIRWMVGPYWSMLIVTYLIVFTITALVYATVVPVREIPEIVVGLILTAMTILFLSLTAFSDPGVFPKHDRPKGPNWNYSGQAQSFRPPNVIFCRESMLLIEDYDHFCPWSGTVIGGKNVKFFHCFVSCLVLTMIYDVVLLSMALVDQGDAADDAAFAQE